MYYTQHFYLIIKTIILNQNLKLLGDGKIENNNYKIN